MCFKNILKEPYPKVYLYRRIVQAKLFIDQHYAESIDLNNISNEGYFSKFHFIRLFKKIYHKTPHQYLTAVRIERAVNLLQSGTPISEVCYAVGFQSLSSFSGLFKKIMGLTPTAHISAYQKVQCQIRQAPLTLVPGCFARRNGWLKEK